MMVIVMSHGPISEHCVILFVRRAQNFVEYKKASTPTQPYFKFTTNPHYILICTNNTKSTENCKQEVFSQLIDKKRNRQHGYYNNH